MKIRTILHYLHWHNLSYPSEHLSLPTPGFKYDSCYSIFSFICMICRSLFVLLAIVLSVLLWHTDSDYPFGIVRSAIWVQFGGRGVDFYFVYLLVCVRKHNCWYSFLYSNQKYCFIRIQNELSDKVYHWY
jgi:hypothetical protein